MQRHAKATAVLATLWRLTLTAGTGLIFGFLVARDTYDGAMMAPLFIAMSFSLGTAVFVIVLCAASSWTGRPLIGDVLVRLGRLQALFVAVVLFMVVVSYLVKLYSGAPAGVVRFLLADGGAYTTVFWVGQILIGSIAPLGLLLLRWSASSVRRTLSAALLVVLGGFAQIYVIIVAGQAYPLTIFPGKEVIESAFFDGVVSRYSPSMPEALLGIGGVATVSLIVVLALKLFELLPSASPE